MGKAVPALRKHSAITARCYPATYMATRQASPLKEEQPPWVRTFARGDTKNVEQKRI